MIKKILIIDDDEELCMELSEILSDEGYNVETVNNGLKGLELLNRHDYDLLLLDLKISGLTGFEILMKLKENNHIIKVFIITGRPETSNMPRELTEIEKEEDEILKSATLLIQKPFKINFLIDKIKEFVAI